MPYQPSYEQYIVALSRKAKNHSAREYRFRAAGEAGDTKATPAPRRSAAALKAITTKYVRALQEGKWFDEIRECRAKCDVYEFIHIQERLLTELSLHPYYIPACLQAVHKRSKSKMVSLYDMLASTASTFGKLHCPDAAVPALFALLERPLPATLPEGEVKYQKQIERACSPPDRQLGRQEHPRCVGFLPTQLQRDVMECVDHGENVVMRSPTGTGKTMISLYLAQCTRDRGKATLYVAPTKLICNEFSIFAYHQGLRISINTEDFSSRREIREALLRQGILIWTPEELFMYLLNPSEGLDLLSQVGSIIFDELPRMLTTHRSATSFLLLAAATRELQMMVLSANISNDTVDHLLNELALFSLQESGDALKPTDLLLHTYEPQDKRLQLIETSSLYTRELLRRREGDRLSIALRIPITWKELTEFSRWVREIEEPNPTSP